MAEVYAEGFLEYPLFRELFPEDAVRKKALPIFFEAYIESIYDYSDIYASSSNLEAVATVYDPEREDSKLRCFIKSILAKIKSLKMCRWISLKHYFKVMAMQEKVSSRWVIDIVKQPYMHLDYLVVQKKYRGQGLMSQMMEAILGEIDQKKLACTLETHNTRNVGIYNHFGYDLVKTIRIPEISLKQYCLVYRPSN